MVPVSTQDVERAVPRRVEIAAPARPLSVLAVGTDDWAVEQAATALASSGHRILRCHEPGEPAFPCNALIEGRTCPLEVGFDVAVTVRARPLPSPVQGETGVICALRNDVPLVVAGMTSVDPFAQWESVVVEPGGDVTSACEEAAPPAVIDLTEFEEESK